MNRNFKILLTINFLALQFLFISGKSFGQAGCTDPQATNYNTAATINDGSCLYPSTTIALTDKTALSTPLLDETSGIVIANGSVWTHNDSGNNNTIYRIDSTSNTVLQTVVITNATNVDWEDITADNNYIYIADCGNNNGNRMNLKIYRVAKSALTTSATTATADLINFSYSDQTVFTSLPNNNNYDCESIIFFNDSLHLFSKNWVDKKTRHYVLPATPGTHIATVKETLNAGFLVTGAGVQQNGILALIGYDNTGVAPIYFYLLYDFKNSLFFNGNKRRFNAGNALTYGQTESIDFKDGAYGYITNERFQQSIINVAPKLRSFNLTPYLPSTIFGPPPLAGFSQNKDSVCAGLSIQFIDTSKNQPTIWHWSLLGGTPSSSSLQNPTVTYSTPGTYDVILTATNAYGTNTKTKTAAVVVKQLPSATITANGPTQFCVGGSVTLSASTGTGYLYQWKRSQNNIAKAIHPTYLAKTTGNFSVVITSNGCTKQSNAISVIGPPAPTITVTGSLNVCNGDSVRLRASTGAGYSYQWQKNQVNIPGATFQNFYAKTLGGYRVAVTDSYGCSKFSGTKNITNNCPAAKIAESDTPFSLYPNPFSDAFIIEMNESNDVWFAVLDITGKEVISSQQLEANEAVSIGAKLKPGIYFVRVSSDEKTWVTRMIKSR